MPVTKKKTRMKRTQISLEPEQYEAARRLASKRGVSLSEVMREALDRLEQGDEAQADEQFDSLQNLFGVLKGVDPNASVDHDRILYERGEEE